MPGNHSENLTINNKKAKYNYQIELVFEAGIILEGKEVKSLRAGKASIDNAYALEKKNEIWMQNFFIENSNENNIESKNNKSVRPRKLLLKKKEISKIKTKLNNQGYSFIPMKIFFNKKGIAKVSIGLSKGRKLQDKREYKKKMDWKKQQERLVKK